MIIPSWLIVLIAIVLIVGGLVWLALTLLAGGMASSGYKDLGTAYRLPGWVALVGGVVLLLSSCQ